MGIDVSKGYSDFLLINEQKEVLMNNFQLDDNRDGHQLLENVFKEIGKEYIIICAVENTGGYERNWVELLRKMSKKDRSI